MVGGEQIIGGNGARDSDSWNHVCPNATRKALAVQNTECSRGAISIAAKKYGKTRGGGKSNLLRSFLAAFILAQVLSTRKVDDRESKRGPFNFLYRLAGYSSLYICAFVLVFTSFNCVFALIRPIERGSKCTFE